MTTSKQHSQYNDIIEEEYIENSSGTWNNVMDKKERVGLTVKRLIDMCKKTFKDFDSEMLLNVVWDKGYDELIKYNTKYGRKEKKKNIEFKSTIIKKPPRSGFIIFNMECAQKYRDTNDKYSSLEVRTSWANFSEEKKAQYSNRAKDLNLQYRKDVTKEKEQAIVDGLYPKSKPKRASNEWILFRMEIYQEVSKSFEIDKNAFNALKNAEEKTNYKKKRLTAISDEIRKRWKNVSSSTLNRLSKLKEENSRKYLEDIAIWEKEEDERLQKLKVSDKEVNSSEKTGDYSGSDSDSESTDNVNDDDNHVPVNNTDSGKISINRVTIENVASVETLANNDSSSDEDSQSDTEEPFKKVKIEISNRKHSSEEIHNDADSINETESLSNEDSEEITNKAPVKKTPVKKALAKKAPAKKAPAKKEPAKKEPVKKAPAKKAPAKKANEKVEPKKVIVVENDSDSDSDPDSDSD